MNIIILNAGKGSKTKSYGPKALMSFGGNRKSGEPTILSRQIDILTNYYQKFEEPVYFYHVLGFEHHKVTKYLTSRYGELNGASGHYVIINEDYENTNQLYSLSLVAKPQDNLEFDYIESGLVVLGDTIFDNEIELTSAHNTVFTSTNILENKVGINHSNQDVSHMLWGLPLTWAQMMYLDEQAFYILSEMASQPMYKKAYLFELVNYCINNNVKFKFKSLASDIVDANQISDLGVASAKFSIS